MVAGPPKEMIKMKKKLELKLLSVLCVIAFVFLALSASGFSGNKERVEEWIGEEGGFISLDGRVTIEFGEGVLAKKTKIFIIDFGDGLYQFGPEIKVNGTFTVCFAEPPISLETFKQGEWIEVDSYDGSACFETNHFSRYRGAW